VGSSLGGTVRIHFTTQDLARTYLADDPDPLWELVNSLQALQGRYGGAVLGRWRQHVAADLHGAGLAARIRDRLFPVAPHAAYFPDLLTPAEAALGADAGIDAILHTPRRRLAAEIGRLAGGPGSGTWLADLRTGRARTLAELGDALRVFHRRAIAPYWDRLRTNVHRDLATRRKILRDHSVDDLLHSFRPLLHWRRPHLVFAQHPSSREIRLGGRGLRLVPSHFCQTHPVTIFDIDLPQVVVYPVQPDPHWLTAEHLGPNVATLAQLLGTTRAAVLCAARGTCTTTELARRANTSLASTSRHAALLRRAGLLATERRGGSVLHTMTALGMALAAGAD
jgi:DNA-binding transcriptional ArsR family regulator